MIATDAEVWARLRLVQGRSSAELWEFVSARGQTVLTVGASPNCTWPVQDAGVAPVHFTLHWDGSALSIADTHGTGSVRLDGAPIRGEWRSISGRARIDFGEAAIVVETSGATLDRAHTWEKAPLPPVSRETRRASSPPIEARVAVSAVPKSTLLGVAGPDRAGSIMATVARKVSASEAPQDVTTGTGGTSSPAANSAGPSGFVPKRPGDSARPAPKPTLLGMAHAPITVQPARASEPPKRVGGASLADGDQRTIQGFPSAGGSVRAAASVAIAGSPSSAPPVQSAPEAAAQVSQQPSSMRPVPVAATALVVHQREESGRQVRQRPDAPYAHEQGEGRALPGGVVVLSPVGGPTAPQPGSWQVAPRRELPSWRPIVFGTLATLVTYGCWLYLLHHL